MTVASSSNASTTTTGTAVSLTLPTWTVGNGDPVILWVVASVSTTISTPTGYWPIMQTQPGTPTIAAFMKYARSGDSGASVSITLGTAASWSVIAYVPTAGSSTAYTVDTNSVNPNHAASTTGAFLATSRNTSPVPTIGTAGGAIGIEFFGGLPGSGQTDTLTVPTGYGSSIAKASTKTTSVNVSAMVCSTTSATITAGTAYTPPSVTQSVSVKFSSFFISLVPVAALTGIVQYATFGGNGTAPSFGAGGAQRVTLPAVPTVGNLIVLALTWSTADNANVSMSPAIGASGGFTLGFGSLTGGVTGGPNGVILYRYVQSGDDAWTITDTSSWVTASMWEFSHPNPTTPFDGTPTWASNTGAAALPAAHAITPGNASDVAITFIVQDAWPDYNIVGAGTPWSNFTPVGMQNSALYQAHEWAYYNNPPTGTALNSNWTTSTTATSQYAITFLVNQSLADVLAATTQSVTAGQSATFFDNETVAGAGARAVVAALTSSRFGNEFISSTLVVSSVGTGNLLYRISGTSVTSAGTHIYSIPATSAGTHLWTISTVVPTVATQSVTASQSSTITDAHILAVTQAVVATQSATTLDTEIITATQAVVAAQSTTVVDSTRVVVAAQAVIATQSATVLDTEIITATQATTAAQSATTTDAETITAAFAVVAAQSASPSDGSHIIATAQAVTATQATTIIDNEIVASAQAVTAAQSTTIVDTETIASTRAVIAHQATTMLDTESVTTVQAVTAAQSATLVDVETVISTQAVTATLTGSRLDTETIGTSQAVIAAQAGTPSDGTDVLPAALFTVTATQAASMGDNEFIGVNLAVTAGLSGGPLDQETVATSQAVTAALSASPIHSDVLIGTFVVTAGSTGALSGIETVATTQNVLAQQAGATVDVHPVGATFAITASQSSVMTPVHLVAGTFAVTAAMFAHATDYVPALLPIRVGGSAVANVRVGGTSTPSVVVGGSTVAIVNGR